MKQSPLASFAESAIGTLAGFLISLGAQMFFLPLLGVPIAWTQNLAFAVIMTAISVARTYIMRRVFEFFRIAHKMTPGLLAIAAERQRQVDVKGYTIEHDDGYAEGILARAGAAYALGDHVETIKITAGDELIGQIRFRAAQVYPWKGGVPARDFRTALATAGAFMAAEIERHDRARQRGAA